MSETKNHRPFPTPEFISKVIVESCRATGCTESELIGRDRHKATVAARGIAAKILYDATRMSLMDITKEIRPSGVTHSGVGTAIRLTNTKMKWGDEPTIKLYAKVRERVEGLL